VNIIDVKATPVFVPMEAPLRWSMGVETGTVRTIIELQTDEGIVGLGETYGGASTAQAVDEARPFFIGLDPFEIQTLVKRFEVFRITSEQMAKMAELKNVGAGIEMACWDILGKVLDKPASALWGGADRDRIEFVAHVFYRYEQEGRGGEGSPEAIVDRYSELAAVHGFRGLKLKGGVFPPDEELQALRLLRETFGERIRWLRFDPNQAWSVPMSIATLCKMRELDLEYVEDPTWDFEGLARVRRSVPEIVLATNQAVVGFANVPPALAMQALDVILVDLYFWGGISQAKKLAVIADVFGLGLAIHSDRELGVGTAAGLHFVASTPQVCHAYDSHYHDQVHDVITEPFRYVDGHITVPTGPGLGVELDPEAFDRAARAYTEQGDRFEFFDPHRPGWTPHLPLW
jgi:glucarate dehydratase